MAVQEPSDAQFVDYFKAMASGKIQDQDLGSIGKAVGGRNSHVLHYKMTYPNGPAKPPIQIVTSEVQQDVDQAKAELGLLKRKSSKHKSKSLSGHQNDNTDYHHLKKYYKKAKKKHKKGKKENKKKNKK